MLIERAEIIVEETKASLVKSDSIKSNDCDCMF